jgi:hypothetical protein
MNKIYKSKDGGLYKLVNIRNNKKLPYICCRYDQELDKWIQCREFEKGLISNSSCYGGVSNMIKVLANYANRNGWKVI